MSGRQILSTMDVKDLLGGGEAAKALIERFGDAFSAMAHPVQVIRNAKAEGSASVIQARAQVEVDKIKTYGALEVTEIQDRGLARLVQNAGKEQENLESILIQALPELSEDAKPQDIEDDWLSNFFDKGRLVSDTEMQFLLGKILAGEANEPRTYSKRTVNFLQELSRNEAELFRSVCRFNNHGELLPLIYDEEDEIYRSNGVNLRRLYQLQGLGLLTYSNSGNQIKRSKRERDGSYSDTKISVRLPDNIEPNFDIGRVIYTVLGVELAKLCVVPPVEGFADYLVAKWTELGYEVTVISSNPTEDT